MELKRSSALLWLAFFVLINFGESCNIAKNSEMTTYDIFRNSPIIVYGQDMKHVERIDKNLTAIKGGKVEDCEFKVYCFIKGGENISEEMITIEHISPRTSCSGSAIKLQVGAKKIVVLRKKPSGNYEFNEINALQSAVFTATSENIQILTNVSQSTNMSSKKECFKLGELVASITAANSTETAKNSTIATTKNSTIATTENSTIATTENSIIATTTSSLMETTTNMDNTSMGDSKYGKQHENGSSSTKMNFICASVFMICICLML